MRLLGDILDGVSLSNDWCFDALDTDIAAQFQQIARLMKQRDSFEAHRDVFYSHIGGFDTHSDNGPALTALLTQIDNAIGCFQTQMSDQGIWNNVTVRETLSQLSLLFETFTDLSLADIFRATLRLSADCLCVRIWPNSDVEWPRN